MCVLSVGRFFYIWLLFVNGGEIILKNHLKRYHTLLIDLMLSIWKEYWLCLSLIALQTDENLIVCQPIDCK